MLSRALEQTIHHALSLASERRHEFATLEHLLLALAHDADAATVLRACDVDLDKLCADLTEFLDKDLAGLATDKPDAPKPTAGFQRAIQRAAIHVQSSGRDEVTGANVLVALFSERESHAVYFLHQQEITRLMPRILSVMASRRRGGVWPHRRRWGGATPSRMGRRHKPMCGPPVRFRRTRRRRPCTVPLTNRQPRHNQR
jgi:ATP-dependent Clp protease ATP-binding subunit ClpA